MPELMFVSLLFDLKYHLFLFQDLVKFVPADILLLFLHLFESDVMMKDRLYSLLTFT